VIVAALEEGAPSSRGVRRRFAMLIPPWNRIAPEVVRQLPNAGSRPVDVRRVGDSPGPA
jgi:hypothetical protein